MNFFEQLNPQALKCYQDDGYFILKNYLQPEDLRDWEQTIIKKYALQALKIGAFHQRLAGKKNLDQFSTVEDLDEILILFEEIDKKAAYFANQNVAASRYAHLFAANKKLTEIASQVLKCPENLLEIPAGYPAFFLSLPSSIRLMYDWHSEHKTMPQRQNFINFWMPTFRNKRDGNGTMYLRKGSHKRHHYHINVQKSGVSVIQQAITEDQLQNCEIVKMECDAGDVVAFDGNMVHSGSFNSSDKPSYVTVLRMFDYRRDLTLSFEPNAGWRTEDYGREDLIPISNT